MVRNDLFSVIGKPEGEPFFAALIQGCLSKSTCVRAGMEIAGYLISRSGLMFFVCDGYVCSAIIHLNDALTMSGFVRAYDGSLPFGLLASDNRQGVWDKLGTARSTMLDATTPRDPHHVDEFEIGHVVVEVSYHPFSGTIDSIIMHSKISPLRRNSQQSLELMLKQYAKDKRCRFCNKHERDVDSLIERPFSTVRICGECIDDLLNAGIEASAYVRCDFCDRTRTEAVLRGREHMCICLHCLHECSTLKQP